jgi:hypothetical protein
MNIDRETLEAIVREVVERLLKSNPELCQSLADSATPPPDGTFEHYGRVLSEGDLMACRKHGKRTIRCDAKTIITPLARDRARDLGIRIATR